MVKKMVCLVVFMTLLTGNFSLSVKAAGKQQSNNIPSKNSVFTQNNISFNQYLVALDIPNIKQLNIPSMLSMAEAKSYVNNLSYAMAAPWMQKLARLQKQGLVSHFQVRPELFAIAISTSHPDEVTRVLGNKPLITAGSTNPPSCLENTHQALVDQALANSRIALNKLQSINQTGSTNPSIIIDLEPGNPYTPFGGTTNPNTTVSMRILSNGAVIVSQSDTSESDGSYGFAPTYISCPNNGFNWTLKPGYVVEVTANGVTVSMTVPKLSSWMDPATNIVSGQTDPGKKVEINVYQTNPGSYDYSKTTTASSDGSFGLSFIDKVDFNGRSNGLITVYDANNNGAYMYTWPFSILSDFGSYGAYGKVKPEHTFQITLRRGGTQIASFSGTSEKNGSYSADFGQLVQPGDVLTLTSEDVNMSYTAVDLQGTYLNPATDHLTGSIGSSGAGWTVTGVFHVNPGIDVATSCNYMEATYAGGGYANASGNFDFYAGFDVQRADQGSIQVYDQNGNGQFLPEIYAPDIHASLPDYISGFWRNNMPGTLTVTLKDSSDVIQWSDSQVYVSPNGQWFAYPNVPITGGDKIEVTDGINTELMTVSNLTGRFRGNTGHISGTASNGKLIVDMYDLQPATGDYHFYCSESNITNGLYDRTFSGASTGGNDWTDLWNIGADGQYTSLTRHTFSLTIEKDGHAIYGYTETPNSTVDIALMRSDESIDTATFLSATDGYFSGELSSAEIEQGDHLLVTTNDGDSVDILIPDLTVGINAVTNSIIGDTPANQGVMTWAKRMANQYGSYMESKFSTSNSQGQYSASFAGRYWALGCYPLNTGNSCTWAEVDYYRPDGQLIWTEMDRPAPVEADSYEDDNNSAPASHYTAAQSHTFHQNEDVDWVNFTVSADDVAKKRIFYLYTYNLGFGMDTVITLYDTDGITELAKNDNASASALDSLLRWAFTAPGTYYLKVEPFSAANTTYCDATYSLAIINQQITMPLIMK